MGFDFAHFGGNFAAVHSRHGIVEHDGIDGFVVENGEAGGSIVGGEDGISGPLKDQFTDLQTDNFIIDAEYDMSILRQNNTRSLQYCGEDTTAPARFILPRM